MHLVCISITLLANSMPFFHHAGACTQRQYRCDNGNCVRGSDVCNGDNNCGDNSDEMQCGGGIDLYTKAS